MKWDGIVFFSVDVYRLVMLIAIWAENNLLFLMYFWVNCSVYIAFFVEIHAISKENPWKSHSFFRKSIWIYPKNSLNTQIYKTSETTKVYFE